MKNYFLGIGIDRYKDRYIHQLKSAVRDVEKIQELLVEYYLFDASNSTMLLNEKATKESIIKQVDQYHLIDEKFNLIIYFAGHGELHRELHTEEGYILPHDAYKGDSDSFINQGDLLGRLEKIDNCHHLLLLWDSCFSGSLFDVATRHGPTAEINYFTYPSRYAFTSGRKFEKVKDGGTIGRSPFSDAITGILKSQSGRDIPITELATRLMPHFVGFRQNPISGALLMKGHNWGEFVFESKVPEDAFNIEPNVISPAVPPPVVFFGREQELYAIRHNLNALANRNRILLLHAEGGMGKTSLAAMYWQINKFRYSHLAWLFCGNGIYEEALPQLAYMLDIDLSQGQNLVFSLSRKLKNLKDPILLVLDNANEGDEIKKFNDDFGKLGLHVLVTSRYRNIMVNPVEEMSIDHLSPNLARNLFIEYYNEDNEEFDLLLDQFLEAISYHTLLIEVFAKNLKEATSFGASSLSMKSFLLKLESSGLFLKEKSFGMYTEYTGYVKKDAITTDDILNILYDFSKLEEQERVLLVNFSLLPIASYDIPSLVRLMKPEDHYQYGNTLKKLFRMGWIGGGDGSFRMSPVIQNLVIEKNRETLWEDGVDLVNEINSNMELMSEEDTIIEKTLWIPYAENIYKIYGRNLNYQEYFELLRNYCVILSHGKNKNNFLRAIDLLQQIINFDLKYYNENSSIIINNKIRLSAMLSETGDKKNLILARDILSQILSSTLASNPRNKILIGTLYSNLALILKDIGGIDNIKKGINIVKNCLNYINETNTHYIVLTLRHTLSLLLYELNDRNSLLEAIFNLECNLNSFSSSSETHDIEYAMTYSLLGQVLLTLGGKENVTKAQFLIEESIKLFKTILGDDNLLIAHNYSNLSLILNDIDRFKNTEISIKLSLKALEIIEKNGSKGTLDHFILNNNLALALQNSGKLSNLLEAKAVLKKSLNFIRTSIYCGHYIEGQCLSNLAMILYDIGEEDNLKTAIPLLIKALEIQEMNFKKDSSQFGLVENNLARILADLGGKTNLIEARRLSQDALRIEIMNHGLESIQALTCLSTQFSILKELGDEDALMSYLVRLKEGFKYLLNHYGEEYELTIIVKNLLKCY